MLEALYHLFSEVSVYALAGLKLSTLKVPAGFSVSTTRVRVTVEVFPERSVTVIVNVYEPSTMPVVFDSEYRLTAFSHVY